MKNKFGFGEMTKKQKIILGSSAIVLIMLILGLVFLWNPATTNNKDNITTVLGAPGKKLHTA